MLAPIIQGSEELHPAADKNELTALINLKAVTPTGKNHTYLGKKSFSNAYKLKPLSDVLIIKINDIYENGDKKGDKTESIVDDLMNGSGYSKLNGKYGGNKGFDGIYIKGTISYPKEILIIECKQFRYHLRVKDSVIEHVGIALNQPNVSTGLPAQMSNAWVEFVAKKLKEQGKTEIADMIDDNKDLIKKYVSAVDKYNGEVYFFKLDSIY